MRKPYIKNKQEIATTKLRRQVLEIVEAGIASVLPAELIKPAVKYNKRLNSVTILNKKYHLMKGRIFIIGGGKASGAMAEALERIIGPDNIIAGVVNTIKGKYNTDKIKIIEAGHPLPDNKGVKGVEEMLELKNKYDINEHDLVICLISGGGSALMPCPIKGISLKDKQKTTELLIKSGASIQDINIVRKHLSQVKGGCLGQYFSPAKVMSIIISDVVGNDLGTIASGPTVGDPSTFKDAQHILVNYKIFDKVPGKVREYIIRGASNKGKETPKRLINCDNYIIGSNVIALEVMTNKAREFGFRPLIITSGLTGETVKVANRVSQEIICQKYVGYDILLIGGETTPQVLGDTDKSTFATPFASSSVKTMEDEEAMEAKKATAGKSTFAKATVGKSTFAKATVGKGGRNQHFVAASLLAMQGLSGNWAMASVATDGSDYIREVAGAIVDNSDLARIKDKGINVQAYLDNYDTYSLFKKLGHSLIVTGNTRTNVGDVIVYALG